MYMSAWQTKTRGSTGNIPIFVMLLTAWGMKCSVSWLMGQDSPAVLSLLWHTTAGESFRAYTVSQKKEGWDAGENTRHRESSCSGKKSLPALAGQWKMQSMSMAAHQISGRDLQMRLRHPWNAATHTLLQSLEDGDKTDWISLVYKPAITYFLIFWKIWLAKELKHTKIQVSILMCGMCICIHDLCLCRLAKPEQDGTEAEEKADLTCLIFVNIPERKSHCL